MEAAARVFVYPNGPASWMAHHLASGIGAMGATREAATAAFRLIWTARTEVRFVDGPPPRPRRDGFADADQSKSAVPAPELEPEWSRVFNAQMMRFHPDRNPDATFSGSEVTAALIELRDAMRGDG